MTLSSCWRLLQARQKAAFFPGQPGWARWAWSADLFFASNSCISWLFSSNQSLFFLEANPRTSSDAMAIKNFKWSHIFSREGSAARLGSSSLDCRFDWKSAFISANCRPLMLIFLHCVPPLLGFGLKRSCSLKRTKLVRTPCGHRRRLQWCGFELFRLKVVSSNFFHFQYLKSTKYEAYFTFWWYFLELQPVSYHNCNLFVKSTLISFASCFTEKWY